MPILRKSMPDFITVLRKKAYFFVLSISYLISKSWRSTPFPMARPRAQNNCNAPWVKDHSAGGAFGSMEGFSGALSYRNDPSRRRSVQWGQRQTLGARGTAALFTKKTQPGVPLFGEAYWISTRLIRFCKWGEMIHSCSVIRSIVSGPTRCIEFRLLLNEWSEHKMKWRQLKFRNSR